MPITPRHRIIGGSPETMGRFAVDFEVVNHEDVICAKLGQLREEKIRKALVHGIVDTGASHLVLPGAVAAALGLPERMRAPVQYADNRTAIRVFVEEVEVRLLGRSSVFEAIVEPDCPEPLVGAMVLEQLDLVVNCKTQQLEPRDPRGVLAYI